MAVLLSLWILLSIFDAWFTPQQLNRVGVQKELMPLQRYLFSQHKLLGQAGIVLPSLAAAILAWFFHAQTFLAVLVGMRLMLAIRQHEQMKSW